MNIEEAIFAHAKAATTSSLAGRVHAIKLPQPPTDPAKIVYPAMVFQRVAAGERSVSHDGSSALAHPRYQFDIWATKLADAQLAARQLRAAFHAFQGGTMGGPVGVGVEVDSCFLEDDEEGWDDERQLWHVRHDYVFQHHEP